MTNQRNTLPLFPKLIFLYFLLLCGNQLSAQVPTVQDCLGAIPICTEIYTETSAPTGAGNYLNEINGTSQGGISCMDEESNSIWYTFTTNQSGNFGFTLTPNNATDDYDWAMFNITGKSCSDIFDDPSCQVSCNASGGSSCNGPTGANGLSAFNNQGANCNNFPPTQFAGNSPNNALVPVAQGNTYVLVVSNWTGSPFGYTIDFGVSTNIGIIDNILPEMVDADFPPDCGGENIEVTFSENIQCNTIDGNNFQITGPGGPYDISLSSIICGQGGAYTDVFSLVVNPPLEEVGEYTLTLVSNQSTEVLDLCDNPSTLSSFTYEIINGPLQALNLGDDALLCDGDVLSLDAFYPNADSYLWQDGSTNSSLQVAQSGNYSVTVTNACNEVVDDINVQILPLQNIDVDLGMDTVLCPNDLYELDATWSTGSSYTWQDGFAGAVYTVSEPGFYEVQIEGFCGEMGTASVQVGYEPTLSLELGNDTILCEGEILNFDVAQPFVNSIVWQDGSTAPTFEATQTGNVSVTIMSNCMTLTDDVFVNFVPLETVDVDLGNDTMLCPGELLELNGTWGNGIAYEWQDGFSQPIYTVSEAGIYEVEIVGACGEMGTAMIEVLYDETVLNLNLGVDTVVCEEDGLYVLDASDFNAQNYEWQDGSNGSFFQVQENGIYAVTISDACNIVTDEIRIDFTNCTICEVFVPNAFSPNFNGYNDYFRPYSNCDLLNFSMKIFNRWGALVFETNDEENGWDGTFNNKTVTEGVYVYLLEFEVNQMDENLKRKLSGDITVTK